MLRGLNALNQHPPHQGFLLIVPGVSRKTIKPPRRWVLEQSRAMMCPFTLVRSGSDPRGTTSPDPPAAPEPDARRFQVVCPGGEFDERIFPAEDGEILGPSGDSFGASDRTVAPRDGGGDVKCRGRVWRRCHEAARGVGSGFDSKLGNHWG